MQDQKTGNARLQWAIIQVQSSTGRQTNRRATAPPRFPPSTPLYPPIDLEQQACHTKDNGTGHRLYCTVPHHPLWNIPLPLTRLLKNRPSQDPTPPKLAIDSQVCWSVAVYRCVESTSWPGECRVGGSGSCPARGTPPPFLAPLFTRQRASAHQQVLCMERLRASQCGISSDYASCLHKSIGPHSCTRLGVEATHLDSCG